LAKKLFPIYLGEKQRNLNMMLKAVVFDWAGTMIDHGSRAPMGAFVRVFADFGVAITVDEARGPMGMPKWDHINTLLSNPDIAARWKATHGAAPTSSDVDRIFEVFVPLNASVVADYADVIPGILETIALCRGRAMKIGSTTGYTRSIMERVLPLAANQGLVPDNLVCAGDTEFGRPTPHMMYKCFLDLGVWPASSVVKVDDTDVGIQEGLAAGSWTVAVTLSGNATGLSLPDLTALTLEQRETRRVQAVAKLKPSGAHYYIDSVADLPTVLDEIETRMANGERPQSACR
jgi:phosphonoacetaldehyde hydrolase